MAAFKCPHCGEQSISLTQKYRLGWWAVVNCKQCDGRVAAFPWVLMMLTMTYLWNVLWWIGLANFEHSYHYLFFMIPCWLLLDFFNLYFIPLCRLKKKDPS